MAWYNPFSWFKVEGNTTNPQTKEDLLALSQEGGEFLKKLRLKILEEKDMEKWPLLVLEIKDIKVPEDMKKGLESLLSGLIKDAGKRDIVWPLVDEMLLLAIALLKDDFVRLVKRLDGKVDDIRNIVKTKGDDLIKMIPPEVSAYIDEHGVKINLGATTCKPLKNVPKEITRTEAARVFWWLALFINSAQSYSPLELIWLEDEKMRDKLASSGKKIKKDDLKLIAGVYRDLCYRGFQLCARMEKVCKNISDEDYNKIVRPVIEGPMLKVLPLFRSQAAEDKAKAEAKKKAEEEAKKASSEAKVNADTQQQTA